MPRPRLAGFKASKHAQSTSPNDSKSACATIAPSASALSGWTAKSTPTEIAQASESRSARARRMASAVTIRCSRTLRRWKGRGWPGEIFQIIAQAIGMTGRQEFTPPSMGFPQ